VGNIIGVIFGGLSACWRILHLQISHYSRWGLYPQGIFIVTCYWWWYCEATPPGLAIAALGAAAIIMTVRAEHFTKTEQVVWVFIGFVLFLVEARAIYQDRSEHDAIARIESAKQHAEFESVLNQNQREFDATMKRVGQVFEKTTEAANASTRAADSVTGGDSFAYVDFSSGLNTSEKIVKIGDPPLYDLNVHSSIHWECPPFPCRSTLVLKDKEIGTLPVGPVIPGNHQHIFYLQEEFPANAYALQGEGVYLTVDLSARNANWKEFYWIYRSNNGEPGDYGFRVYKVEYNSQGKLVNSKLLRQYIGPCLPEDMLGSDDLATKHSASARFYEFENGRFLYLRKSCSAYSPKRQ
jgi:hypothetical protein